MLFASAVSAQIIVRSGEHAAFSRLAFAAPSDATWTVDGVAPGNVTVGFQGLDGTLDGGAIFDRIPKTRLQMATADDQALRLGVACRCDIRISHVPSGHIALDIVDRTDVGSQPGPGQSFVMAATTTLSFRRPTERPVRVHSPLSDLLMAGPRVPSSRANRGPQNDQLQVLAPASTPQFVVRSSSRPAVFPAPDLPEPPPEKDACEVEDRLADILNADPEASWTAFSRARRTLLDAKGAYATERLHDLARAHAAMGMGQEALQILDISEEDEPAIRMAASALDDLPIAISDALSRCGPASMLVVLLSGTDDPERAVADADGLALFIAGLPPTRWADLAPRVTRILADAYQDELLVALPAGRPGATLAGSGSEVDAGTGYAAMRSIITTFDNAANAGMTVSAAQMENALALRISLPAGAATREFDRAVADALLRDDRVADAVRLLDSSAITADELLALAVPLLDDGALLDLGARLRKKITPEHPATHALSDAYVRQGLDDFDRRVARRDARDSQPRAIDAGERVGSDAWIQRRFVPLAADPGGGARSELARLVVERNAVISDVDGDLAHARSVSERSSRLRTVIAELAAEPPAAITVD
ncbi:hypothetical protein [uncultured Jannaschia sp.]|uniref:hypothetical protein n=1 Tax=uncultured Jannaschia sp. TaxID=293347 RepID=UPI00261DBDAD|nr:hypothetical protein [uncultured Jannaschia sp.]